MYFASDPWIWISSTHLATFLSSFLFCVCFWIFHSHVNSHLYYDLSMSILHVSHWTFRSIEFDLRKFCRKNMRIISITIIVVAMLDHLLISTIKFTHGIKGLKGIVWYKSHGHTSDARKVSGLKILHDFGKQILVWMSIKIHKKMEYFFYLFQKSLCVLKEY